MQLGVQTTQAHRSSAEDYEKMISVQNDLNSKYSSEIITEYVFNGAGILQEVGINIWYMNLTVEFHMTRCSPPSFPLSKVLMSIPIPIFSAGVMFPRRRLVL